MERGSFVPGDCTEHVRYMDAQCFQSASFARLPFRA
jgi:hypothetical protein